MIESGRHQAADVLVPAELYGDLISAEIKVLGAMKNLAEVGRRDWQRSSWTILIAKSLAWKGTSWVRVRT
jgi:hypothetical protein